jgi:hypothetical protein
MKPHIPWKEFFAASDVLLPQTYWRWTNPRTGQRGQKINGGTPAAAIQKAMPAWKPPSQGKPIVPMCGEADVVKDEELAAFGRELSALNVTEGHFYTDNGLIRRQSRSDKGTITTAIPLPAHLGEPAGNGQPLRLSRSHATNGAALTRGHVATRLAHI